MTEELKPDVIGNKWRVKCMMSSSLDVPLRNIVIDALVRYRIRIECAFDANVPPKVHMPGQSETASYTR